jgi:hypothetical protein
MDENDIATKEKGEDIRDATEESSSDSEKKDHINTTDSSEEKFNGDQEPIKENDQSTNVNNVGRDFNQINYYGKDPKKFESGNIIEESKIHLIIWPNFDKRFIHEYEKEAINKYADELIQQRLILIQCIDETIRDEAIILTVKKVADKLGLKKYENKLLFLDRNKRDGNNNSNLTLKNLVYSLAATDIPCFIKINLIGTEFLESLFLPSIEICHSFTEELEQKGIFIICSFFDPAIAEKIQDNLNVQNRSLASSEKDNLFFPYNEIKFLPILFKSLFKTDWQINYEKIICQQERKLWSKDPQEFRNEIDKFLKQGAEEFAEELGQREKPDFKKLLDEKINELPFSNELHKSLLYIAAFFPTISIYDFRKLVRIVLGDKEIVFPVERENQQPDNQEIYTPKLTSVKKVKLYELWIKEGDKYIEECTLEAQQLEAGMITFDFSMAYIREKVKEYFLKKYPLFLQDQFINVLNAGCFFEFDTSKVLIDNIMQYIIQIAAYDPDQYGANLLIQIFRKIFNPELPIQLDNRYEELDLEERSHLDVYIRIKNFERQELFSRSIELMKLMLDNSEILAKQVCKFLEYLFDTENDIILLETLKNIYNSSQINKLEWIQKILNQNNLSDDVYEKSISTLHWLARKSEYGIYDFLKELDTWNDNGQMNGNYSYSQLQSILFILVIGNPLYYSHFPLKYYGEWPSKFALFVPFTNENDIVKCWQYLIDWLFSEKLKRAFSIVKKSQQLSVDTIEQKLANIQAFTIESWWLIINGIDNKQQEVLQTFASDMLVSVLTESLQNEVSKRVCKHWRILANEYMMTINELREENNDNAAIINLYKAKRETVKMLNNKILTNLKV